MSRKTRMNAYPMGKLWSHTSIQKCTWCKVQHVHQYMHKSTSVKQNKSGITKMLKSLGCTHLQHC